MAVISWYKNISFNDKEDDTASPLFFCYYYDKKRIPLLRYPLAGLTGFEPV